MMMICSQRVYVYILYIIFILKSTQLHLYGIWKKNSVALITTEKRIPIQRWIMLYFFKFVVVRVQMKKKINKIKIEPAHFWYSVIFYMCLWEKMLHVFYIHATHRESNSKKIWQQFVFVYACLQEWKGIKKEKKKIAFLKCGKNSVDSFISFTHHRNSIIASYLLSLNIFLRHTLFNVFVVVVVIFTFLYTMFWIEYFIIFYFACFRWFYKYVYPFLLAFANARTQLFVSDTIENCNKTSLVSNWYYAKCFGLSTLQTSNWNKSLNLLFTTLHIENILRNIDFIQFQKKKNVWILWSVESHLLK